MAIIRDTIITEDRPAKGARVIVRDDCYRGISAEEMERRRMEVARVIRRIDVAWQMRLREQGGQTP